ncbi:hypothetical protein R1sor_002470 [Riccia sorocarpa]|uniref:Malectin-like domain-containing protein n=1 Tax=Riccia sorocarpa TaxID=122646 RepID=A0ABD3GZ98_9MARC
MKILVYLSILLTYLWLQVFISTNAQLTKFLSIDCGASSPYNDSDLGIQWETDDKYIMTGTTRQMREGPDLPKQLYSYRYFPSPRSKQCYVLPVETDTTYLLRARLFPGFREALSVDLPVDFNVTFINNLFFSYSASTDRDRVDAIYESVFYTFKRKEIYLCLVPGSKGTPFINSIELRRLPETSYSITKSLPGVPLFLVLGDRLNMGAKPGDSFFRYPYDDFDRFWWPAVPPSFPNFTTFEVEESSPIMKNLTFVPEPIDVIDPLKFNLPPNRTLTDAWIGPVLAFQIKRSRLDTNEVYVAFYFLEIRPDSEVMDNETDSLSECPICFVEDISSGDCLVSRNPTQVTLDKVLLNDNVINVNVTSYAYVTGNLAVDPILNAFEYYYRYDFNISATYSKDKIALHELQVSFGLQDWQGDPCFPVSWDWLACDSETSRIQKLKLSHMNISGQIPGNISNLMELTEIHLDNNNLQGAIPKSLVSLPKLQRLALDNNDLIGEIPIEFQNKEGFTFTGNPRLGNMTTGSNAPGPSPQISGAVKSNKRAGILFQAIICLASLFVITSVH